MRKIRQWNSLTGLEQALFYELVWICNRHGWSDIFRCTNTYLAATLKITEKSVRKSREQLIQTGLISFRPGERKRDSSLYSLKIDLSTGKALPEIKNRVETVEMEAMEPAKEAFDLFFAKYPGNKRSSTTEFRNLRDQYPFEFPAILPLLLPALEKWEKWRNQQRIAGAFVPSCLSMQNWINQRRWEDEFTQSNTNNHEKGPTIID